MRRTTIPTLACALLAGCGETAITVPSGQNVDLRAARAAHGYTAYYLGDRFEGLPLTYADARDMIYGTCTIAPGSDSGGCYTPVQLVSGSLCALQLLRITTIGPPPPRISIVRGAVVFYRGDQHTDVYTGANAVTIWTRSDARARRAVFALRPVRGGRTRTLPAPRWPRSMLAELERTADAVRRAGSARAARGELGVSRRAIKQRLEFRSLIRKQRRKAPASDC